MKTIIRWICIIVAYLALSIFFPFWCAFQFILSIFVWCSKSEKRSFWKIFKELVLEYVELMHEFWNSLN